MRWAEQGGDGGALRPLVEGHATGHLHSLAEVCGQHPNGLTTLMVVLERIEQGSKHVIALREVVRAMTVPGLWPQEETAKLHRLLHGDGDPHDLLERVRLTRVEAFAEGAESGHVGEKLSVLLDDPVRVVVPRHPAPPERKSVA